MKVTLNGVDYFITFQYDVVPNCRSGLTEFGYYGLTTRTTCIVTKRGFEEIARASVGCYVGDSFSKDVGRKKALTKVLTLTEFGRAGNKLVWEKYLTSTKRAPKLKAQ